MQTPVPNPNAKPVMPSTDSDTRPTDQNLQKFLDFLGKAEGADYNVIVGGKKFQDFSKHPGVVGLRTKEGPSTAAGKYQITKTTYDDYAPKLGITDFSPQSQDRIAIELIRRKGALEDVQKGDFRSAIDKLGSTWASLPSSPYTQPKRGWDFAETTLGVPLGERTQIAKAATQTQKATKGVSPSAKKPMKLASLDTLPTSYRTALALNFLADSDPEDEVMSKAIEVLRTTQEDSERGAPAGAATLQKYIKSQKPVDPFQFVAREEEPQQAARQPAIRRMAQGGLVYRQAGSSPQGERSLNEVPQIGPDGRVLLPTPEPEPELSLAEKARGLIETGATIATGAVAAPIAAVTGLARGKNINEANVEAGKVMEALTYMPRTAAGREYLQQFGKAMQESKLDALLPQAQLLNVRVAPGAARYLGEQAKGKVEEAVMPGLREKAGDPNLTPEQVYDAMLGKPSEVLAGASASYATRPLGTRADVTGDVRQAAKVSERYAQEASLEADDYVRILQRELGNTNNSLTEMNTALAELQNMPIGQLREDPEKFARVTRRVEELQGQKSMLEGRIAKEADRAQVFGNFAPAIQTISDKATDYFSTTFGTVKDPLYKAFVDGRWTPKWMNEVEGGGISGDMQLNYERFIPLELKDLNPWTEPTAGMPNRPAVPAYGLTLDDLRAMARGETGTPLQQEQSQIALSKMYDALSDQTGEIISPYTDVGFFMNPEAKKLVVPVMQDAAEITLRNMKRAFTDQDLFDYAKKDGGRAANEALEAMVDRMRRGSSGASEEAQQRNEAMIQNFIGQVKDALNDQEVFDARTNANVDAFRSELRRKLNDERAGRRFDDDDEYGWGERPGLETENVLDAFENHYLKTLKYYYDNHADPAAGKVTTTSDPKTVAMTKMLYELVGTPEMKKKSIQDIETDLRQAFGGKFKWRTSSIDMRTPEEVVMAEAMEAAHGSMADVYETFYNQVLEQQGAPTSALSFRRGKTYASTLMPDTTDPFSRSGQVLESGASRLNMLNALVRDTPAFDEAIRKGQPVYSLDSNVLWDQEFSPFDMRDITEYAATLTPAQLQKATFADLVVGAEGNWTNIANPKTILNRMEKGRPVTPDQALLGVTKTQYNVPLTSPFLGKNKEVAGWYEITSADGMKAEGLMAQHCIKQPSYYNQYLDGQSKFFTLRDSQGYPKLTIQMLNTSQGRPGIPSSSLPGSDFRTVAQIKGNFNSADAQMFADEVDSFFRNYMRENNINKLDITEDYEYLTPALRGEEPL